MDSSPACEFVPRPPTHVVHWCWAELHASTVMRHRRGGREMRGASTHEENESSHKWRLMGNFISLLVVCFAYTESAPTEVRLAPA
jgi:hypothetical protein